MFKLNVVFLLFFFAPLSCQQCETFESVDGIRLTGLSFSTLQAENIGICNDKCDADEKCKSINYNKLSKKCELNKTNKDGFPSRVEQAKSAIFSDVRRHTEAGSSEEDAVASCLQVKKLNPRAASGNYWISVNPPNAMRVFCDMTTDSGGWTLVYSYHFTDFANFMGTTNALTPVPDWPITGGGKVSSVTPLNETSYSAMNFTLWKHIGREFMVKSNLAHWVACLPGKGDLVNWKEGSITCRVIKTVGDRCLEVVPYQIVKHGDINCGIALYTDDHYFFFEGSTDRCYPVHDSCGKRNLVSKGSALPTIVPNPSGTIYLR
ncbi:uncharacterized protein LOC116620308 [Nematostella vectensis]|uniref:uncharacterized protein LOC116620308 n=1 Tax=Nematostella vectensis TaxID=45351 RepID=UPI002077475C|nr:uncharacterized protein LOC116620308 [Nematostella vectensis]